MFMDWIFHRFLKHIMIGFYIDGDLISALAVLYYWSWKPRATSAYLTSVVCCAYMIGNFDSLLTWEPMPLMVDDNYRVDGFCTTGLGNPTSLVSLAAASLTIYYDNEATLTEE